MQLPGQPIRVIQQSTASPSRGYSAIEKGHSGVHGYIFREGNQSAELLAKAGLKGDASSKFSSFYQLRLMDASV